MLRAAALVSGGGSNLEAILRAQQAGELTSMQVVLVVSSKPAVLAIERARSRGIEAKVLARADFKSEDEFQNELLRTLLNANIDLVCLAGYLRKLGAPVLTTFRGRIVNVHPSLLPKFGGPGMYGHHVHEAVLKAGEKESGCTIHVVDEEYDHGPVLGQSRVPVLPSDTPESLAARILEQEHLLYPRVLQEFTTKLLSKTHQARNP